ncbi:NADH:flavin oxidoreductase/NADH oxidase [Rhodocyclus tenuis]|uniref:Oxidoreductase n=2 Tax=Rhodocyclus TaxID=1064 RepID=A0A6L5JVW9_RHOTE|nr:NADH:flavin oxidoreductase/NADH oxidase [Rhodocyclus gracilis]MQY51527.1 oxidoreductase [Rhodocyclus gracilis]NJA89428.1 NADH:flavin oxidoreductase/NADH oxidase [Rhodocyclus gracilis]
MSHPLFSPFTLRRQTLDNRIVIAPMCMYSATDGKVGDWHTMHLGTLAQSGAGLLIIEATAVAPEGRITPYCPGLWDDACADAWAPVLAAVRHYSTMPLAIQLAHAGRKASCEAPWRGGRQLPPEAGGWPTLAPSALAFNDGDTPPTALDTAGLARLRTAFADAARRADALGIDIIEIHAAHGYLLHEFLSPLSNLRQDNYGGSLENRLRFPLEVFDAVRAVWPAEKALGLRVSADDWVAGGWDIEQTLALARALKARGADFLHVSSGGLSAAQSIPVAPGYQLPFARRVKAETGLTTIAVGLITEPHQADAVIADGDADLVALARGILWNPRWPWHAAAALGATVDAPPQLWRGAPHAASGVFGR